jgi:hypothetical protein
VAAPPPAVPDYFTGNCHFLRGWHALLNVGSFLGAEDFAHARRENCFYVVSQINPLPALKKIFDDMKIVMDIATQFCPIWKSQQVPPRLKYFPMTNQLFSDCD